MNRKYKFMISFIIINLISLLINIKLIIFNGAIANGYINRCHSQIQFNLSNSRDFSRFKCRHLKKINGLKIYPERDQKYLENESKSWFICMDNKIGPIPKKCNVLSIAIDSNNIFDKELNSNYGCNVETIDPFIEHPILSDVRSKNHILRDKINIHLNFNWRFQRTDIIGSHLPDNNVHKSGRDGIFRKIVSLTQLENKIIDIVKIDIEKAEWIIFEDNFDINYLCKYVKQFIIETHPVKKQPGISRFHYNNLKKLEKCFMLYQRTSNIFYSLKNQINIIDGNFIDESDLIDYIITFGRLYFLNKNFI